MSVKDWTRIDQRPHRFGEEGREGRAENRVEKKESGCTGYSPWPTQLLCETQRGGGERQSESSTPWRPGEDRLHENRPNLIRQKEEVQRLSLSLFYFKGIKRYWYPAAQKKKETKKRRRRHHGRSSLMQSRRVCESQNAYFTLTWTAFSLLLKTPAQQRPVCILQHL